MQNEYSQLPPGSWRGALEIEAPSAMAEADILDETNPTRGDKGVYLPFLFEIRYDDNQQMQVDIINGSERTPVERITFGRDKSIAKDTFGFYFDVYDSYIRGIQNEGVMEGTWVRRNRPNYSMPFVAHFSVRDRFEPRTIEPITDISGTWTCQFEIETDTPFPALGEFNQTGNHLSGTFRTETGDYRYLDGAVYGNEVMLSVFDGAHAFLFEAKYKSDSLIGTFYSGNHYKVVWSGNRDDNARLTSPDSLTYLIDGESFDFEFPNKDGEMVSLSDDRYEGKIKVIQIMGTWCPNCRDETSFLVNYLREEQPENIEVIAIAFERYRDEAKNQAAIARYYEHFDMNYEILLGGYHEKEEASKILPMLSEIISYPTLLFVDQKNNVRRIHTGYNGPATSKYDEFVEDFSNTIEEMQNEIIN